MFFYLQMRGKMKKYQIIYKDLEKAIHEQKNQVGDFLPTEQERFNLTRLVEILYERH